MKLSDFYRYVVDLNDSQKGGWASIYYGVFSKIINDNNYKIVAEVGIGYGTHAKEILKNTSVETLYLVDPMVYYPNDGFATDIMNQTPEIPGNNFNEMHDLINKELSPWSSRYTWYRMRSTDITNNEIPDESLDCIFVDGDHSYNAVRDDLRFWWKKIRPGGKMLGDDYWIADVAKAVNEFANEIGQTTVFYQRPGQTYNIFCFTK